MNSVARVARTIETAVKLELIERSLRPIRCPIVQVVDMKLSPLPDYCMLDLGPFLSNLQSWQMWKVVANIKKGILAGTIEHRSWLPGGSRAGIAAHAIWKVWMHMLCI